ncbi:MAG TPA: hypothetical protein VFG77_06215 [Nitrososphaeraceae archaeon]|jgi:hypothetical protein|nr:hypothetical protein [Nitrososphaeraceae archaeon]
MTTYRTSFIIFTSFLIVGSIVTVYHPPSHEVKAQHHGTPPPAAAIGDRKLVLDMQTEPVNITKAEDVLMTIGFLDEGKNANIQHVTFRMDISKDGKHILSDFFHDHNGEVRLMFKDKGGSSSSHTIGGNQDVLTNAWISDPGSPITISGPVFNQSGTYNIDLELSTIDNDKTDLVKPLDYTFDVNVS